MDGKLAGLSRDWVALDLAIQDNLEKVKGGELMLRKTQDDVEVLKRCQSEQTSLMASVSCLDSHLSSSFTHIFQLANDRCQCGELLKGKGMKESPLEVVEEECCHQGW